MQAQRRQIAPHSSAIAGSSNVTLVVLLERICLFPFLDPLVTNLEEDRALPGLQHSVSAPQKEKGPR